MLLNKIINILNTQNIPEYDLLFFLIDKKQDIKDIIISKYSIVIDKKLKIFFSDDTKTNPPNVFFENIELYSDDPFTYSKKLKFSSEILFSTTKLLNDKRKKAIKAASVLRGKFKNNEKFAIVYFDNISKVTLLIVKSQPLEYIMDSKIIYTKTFNLLEEKCDN